MKPVYVFTDKAPLPLGPYSQVVRWGQLIYTSGNLGIDPVTNQVVPGGIGPEAEQTMLNLQTLLTAAGTSWEYALKTTIYLTDLNNFSLVNLIYEKHLNGHKPARSCVQVTALPKGGLIEIEVVAAAAD